MSAFTEEKAKKKWCPYARPAFDGAGVDCIASRCMAWRWKPLFGSDSYAAALPPTHGYCGLAGRPE